MLNKANLDIASITDKENGILITQDCTVANDGRRLIEVTRPQAYHSKDFLQIDNFVPSEIDIAGEIRNCHKDFMISRDDALLISRKIENRKNANPILKNAVISHNGSTQIVTADDKTMSTSVQTVTPLEQKYPLYKEFIPSGENTSFKIGLNPKLLAEICTLADKFQDENKLMVFEFTDSNSAVKMTTVNSETKQKFTAVLMPMRLE